MFFLLTRVLGAFGGGGGQQPTPQKRLAIDEAFLQKSIDESLRTMESYEKYVEQQLMKIMRTEMANVAARTARATPPLNGKGLEEGKKNVEDDINTLFRPLQDIPFGSLVLAQQWTAVAAYGFEFKSKRLTKALGMQDWDTLYKTFANRGFGKFEPYKGRIGEIVSIPSKPKHRSAMTKDGRLTSKRFLVSGPKDEAEQKIQDYIKYMQQGIGKMCGGWIRCFIALQGMGWDLPLDWAKKGKGRVIQKIDGKDKEVSITNDWGNYGGYMAQRYGMFNYILHECAQKGTTRYINMCEDTINRLKMK